MIVYKITNKIDSKSYIGQTVKSLEKRWVHHCTPSSGCRYLSGAIQKYGKENFEVKVLARCMSVEEMNHREQYYIQLFATLSPNGYNLMTGGGNSKPSKETVDRRRKAISGPNHVYFGKKLPETHRQKIADSRIGKTIVCNETGHVYKSIKEAARDIGGFPQHVSRVLNGERKSTRGFSFSYR